MYKNARGKKPDSSPKLAQTRNNKPPDRAFLICWTNASKEALSSLHSLGC